MRTPYTDDGTWGLDPETGRLVQRNPWRGYGLRAVLYGHSYIDEEATSGTYAIQANLVSGTINWANALLGKPFTVIKEAGVGGERVADILARYDLHVKPYDPDIIFIAMGHNDLNNVVNAGTQPDTGIAYAADTTQTRLPVLVARFGQVLDKIPPHVKVVLLAETQPGRTPAGVASTSTHKQLGLRFSEFNRALERLALSRKNVIYVPVDLPILDSASANIETAIGMYEDNVHPSIVGAYKRGKMLAKYLERILPIGNPPLVASHGDVFLNQLLPFTAISGNGTSISVTMDNSAPGSHATIGRIKVGDMVNVQCPTTATYDGLYECTAATLTGITLAGTATGATATGNVCTGRQMLENPLFVTQTGGTKNANITLSSGLLPASYYLNTTAGAGVVSVAVTYAAHADVNNLYSSGYWLELAITTTGAADVILQGTASDLSGGSYYKRLHSGEVIYSGCEVDVTGTIAGFDGVELRNFIDLATDVISADFHRQDGYTVAGVNEAHRVTLLTPEVVLPASLLGVTPQLYMRFSGAGSAKVRIARMCCYRDDEPVRVDDLAVQ